jgi:hypothetical protein
MLGLGSASQLVAMIATSTVRNSSGVWIVFMLLSTLYFQEREGDMIVVVKSKLKRRKEGGIFISSQPRKRSVNWSSSPRNGGRHGAERQSQEEGALQATFTISHLLKAQPMVVGDAALLHRLTLYYSVGGPWSKVQSPSNEVMPFSLFHVWNMTGRRSASTSLSFDKRSKWSGVILPVLFVNIYLIMKVICTKR